MSDGFTRTPTGVVGKWHFHTSPIVWVEGVEDMYFYSPILRDIGCKIQPYHGCGNAIALIAGLVNDDLPYIVVCDGDYDVLWPRRSRHRRLIKLKKYSFENYLWHAEAINYACHRHAQIGDYTDIATSEMVTVVNQLRVALKEAVVLEVAVRSMNPAPKILPEGIDCVLVRQSESEVDIAKVNAFRNKSQITIPTEQIDEARVLVDEFLASRCFSELLNGHLLLGVLMRVFTKLTRSLKAGAKLVPPDAFVQLISDAIWTSGGDGDHMSLKRKIRSELRKLRTDPKLGSVEN
jgi:Protein of unknown function (DUF4435)